MRTTSTNKLTFAALKLAYGITVSMVNRAYVSSVPQVDQFSSLKARDSSGFFGVLVGSAIVGSLIWLMQLIPLDGWSIQLVGLSLAVCIVLLAPAFLNRKRVDHTRGKSVTNPDELADNSQIKSSQRLQKQSQILMALTQPQMLGRGDFNAIIGQITAAAADALEVRRVSLWLYNQSRSQLECVAVHETSLNPHSPSTQPEPGIGGNLRPIHSSLPTRPLTPSPHHPKPVAIAGRLDAPICLNQNIVGVLCYERLTPTLSPWTPEDESFASAIANLVAITLQIGDYPKSSVKNEPKPTEAQIHRSSRDHLLETIPEAFFVVDREWRFSYLNSKTEQFLSRTAEQLLGKSLWDEFPTALGSQFEQQYRRVVAEQVSVKFEEFYPPLQRWLEVRAYPYEGGLSVYLSDITRHKQTQTELLERIRRESLLLELTLQIRQSLELDTILETAVQSIRTLLHIDRCHFLWYINQECEPYWQVVHEAKNSHLPSHIGRYTKTQVRLSGDRLLKGQIIQVDQVETFKNPRLRKFLRQMGYISVLSIPIRTHGGAIGIISCGHCTSLRPWHHSEVELLQGVVAQLTIALDQAELYAQARQSASESQTKARELERSLHQLHATQSQLVQTEKMSSLGQLVAGVAHEINNPVNFIHGNLAYAGAYIYDILNLLRLYQEHYPHPDTAIAEQAELINIDFVAADLPKLLGSMQRGTDRIRSIVQSLRKFSRADEADMKKVDVHEGIESTLLILQHRLKAKGKQPEIIVYKDYGNLPLVECYPGELNQVFMNILINAIEALKPSEQGIPEHASLVVPHPAPAITIRTRLLEHRESSNISENSLALVAEIPTSIRTTTEKLTGQNCQRVVIQIADNGPGMTESVKARLFDPFFTTKPVGQGCGLGLSISYQIVVEHHRGILTCTSKPGKGTELWLEIPIMQGT